MARLYAAARLHVNFFQPSFKLKEKRREGAKVIKRYHAPATPYARALAHPKLSKAVKTAAARALSHARSGGAAGRDARGPDRTRHARRSPAPARSLRAVTHTIAGTGRGERLQRGSARRRRPASRAPRIGGMRKPYKTRVRMPSMLDPHVADIERLARGRAAADRARHPRPARPSAAPISSGRRSTSIVQRLLKVLRRKAAGQLIAGMEIVAAMTTGSTERDKQIGDPSRAQPDLAVPLAAAASALQASSTPVSI